MNKKIILTAYGYVFSEPPSRNALESFIEAEYSISVIHLKKFTQPHTYLSIKNIETEIPRMLRWIPGFPKRFIAWRVYKREVNNWLEQNYDCIIWCTHLMPLAAINFNIAAKNKHKVICNVIDIPSKKYSGCFDKILYNTAYKKARFCYLNIASDKYKAFLFKEFARLNKMPIVLHNCSKLDYFNSFKRNDCKKWLHKILSSQGIIVTNKTTIILRAGAIGKYGGIEETIIALKNIPSETIFVLMGRPEISYKNYLLYFIKENNMEDRVYLFDKPDNYEWKKILLGSDIGHLIHIRPNDNVAAANAYDLNSSLSNNRLFQYMAAGLPILSYNDKRLVSIYNEVPCFSVIDVNNIKHSLLMKLKNLYENPEERRKLGEEAKKAYLDKYNWEAQFKKISDRLN